jgi:hypothetical protein
VSATILFDIRKTRGRDGYNFDANFDHKPSNAYVLSSLTFDLAGHKIRIYIMERNERCDALFFFQITNVYTVLLWNRPSQKFNLVILRAFSKRSYLCIVYETAWLRHKHKVSRFIFIQLAFLEFFRSAKASTGGMVHSGLTDFIESPHKMMFYGILIASIHQKKQLNCEFTCQEK